MAEEPKVKALALISLGLDSILAARIMKDQSIDVHGIHFYSKFTVLDIPGRLKKLEECLRPMNIPYTAVDYSDELRDVVMDPAHGYGSEVNPCIDCRLLALKLAYARMKDLGAKFLITGEVVGQRPMTQNKPTLFHMDKVTGFRGLIVRPLSARILPQTIPEEMGWIDRERCLDISGRSRKEQLQLAAEWNLPCVPQPAGGCILTDAQFGRRLNRLLKKLNRKPSIDELILLRLGRHVWPAVHLQIIVGRHQAENEELTARRKGYWLFFPKNRKGPDVLAGGIKHGKEIQIAAEITARYSGGNQKPVEIQYEGPDGSRGVMEVNAVDEAFLEKWRV